MQRTCRCKSFRCLWWLFASVLLILAHGNNFSQHNQERPHCQPGFYCPVGSFTPLPCPKGTFGPTAGAVSIDSCLKCPPHHYCPRPGLSASLLCGPVAQQPLSGQDTCICPGEGQSFQTSDGRCHCTIGYQTTNNGDVCAHKLYDVCRDGKTRTQYGDCMDRHQWSLHCRQQVCQSAEDYRGYDGELGLCVCREPPGGAACGGLCRSRPAAELQLQCRPSGNMELVWSYESKVSGVSGSVLEMVFKQWDSHGTLQCNSHLNSSRPVYIVQTTDAGFLGLLSGLSKELQQLFPVTTQRDSHSSAEEDSDFLWKVSKVENISHGGREMNSTRMRGNKSDMREDVRSVTGVLNPTACLHLGDVILFTVDTRHYPEYDLDSLYNTNSDFDWGVFRQLKEELTLSWTPPSFFSVVFSQPGVYVFTLSSHQHKHLIEIKVQITEMCIKSPLYPCMCGVGISRRRDLLLRPDWFVTGGLLFGAVVILCLCVTVLILFREYGWPAKEPVRVRYRLLQLAHNMDDYASKGSRVISLRKTHRNQQARMTQDSIQAVCADTSGEFWDYEHQVDLEAFSSNTFYSLLLKQSLSVTTRLGQLTTEVKELYQGVLGKLQLLHPRLITEERMGEGYERMRREVEREVVRRKTLASQLRTLLDSQLQVLRQERQTQQRVHSVFTTHLRECTRLLSKVYNNNQQSCELRQQNLIQRLTFLVDEMGELVSGECQRQGAWELLGEGTGAKLLCPDTGTVLTKDHIFSPDGSLRVCRALHFDSVTGLIRPNAHTYMLLGSCHTTAVPPDFFLHPQTGRVMPIAGNVAYDLASSTLVFMTHSCTGDNRKWDSPLLPFIPYPTSCHSDQPLPSTRLRGLRPGQRLQLGAPMADPDTGVPVPILAVTIHPQTGLVYPLGGVHICPITRLPQPIQIGYPMLDPRTGNVVLTVGVSLDPVTGAVLPVGGVLLAESFIEPLSGRMVRVRGASMRAGQLVPNAGGYQTLLDSKVLAAMFKVLDLLKPLTEEWGSDPTLQHPQPHPGSERGSGRQDHLLAVAKELQQAWGRSLHCQLQLQTRLELLLDWAVGLQQDGGTLGEIPLSGSDVCVPALLGIEYPDPMGSGLTVPVLGCQTDPISGITIPLAGTMEDPDGKGLVAIRYGSQTVDPVTGVLAPVVGARLDVSRKNVLPVTASYWLTVADQTDSVQVEALQREVCVRNTYWQHQRQREEDILSDLDSALFQSLIRITEVNSSQQVQWSGRQLREAAVELQDSAQTEAQRRASQRSHLALILPLHVLHILTLGISTQSLREPVNLAQSQDTGLQASSAPTHNSQRHIASSGIHSQESQPVKESAQPTIISVPTIPEEEWTKLLELSPLFQLLKVVELQLKDWACGAGLLRGELADRGNSFADVLDAQWECEGELIPLDLSVLNPREFLVYQHGLFLMQTLHNLKLTPVISLQIAASLPNNNYMNNAFRNSFFYQEAEEMLFVRRQRLHSVGGFSLLLLHCLSHVKIKDMTSDSSPAFQRLFFKVLQACLGELFQARLGTPHSGQEANLCVWFQDQGAPSRESQGTLSDSHAASLLQRLHKPSRGLLSEDEVEELKRKHRETSLLSHLEELLKEKSAEATERGERPDRVNTCKDHHY
ncbi:uncharacterized protein AKAME5_000956100 [Lates japonicus]|uniref:Uncharacterized protein n=1 Tax=Lates japonicus TaxID=270547 RepID=A0AAD3MP73_LATJO|nr:uncharacterized protein AKAME5_000956100 [Lates japonicus]